MRGLTVGAAVTISILLSGPARAADLIAFTQMKQQVDADVAYRIDGVNKTAVARFDPCTPQGPGDADLQISAARYGDSGTATLHSQFQPDRFTLKGAVRDAGQEQSIAGHLLERRRG
jgi:hypothetical protein